MAKTKTVLGARDRNEYKEPVYDKSDVYGHYKALSDYDRKRLVPTNFWRIVNEKEMINVPDTDLNYWKEWNAGKMEERAKLILQKRDKLKL